jgi:hypothetical protein
VPLRPFVITSKRQELRDQVFRPGWALPTMTIDEYLQQEEERGNHIKGGYVSCHIYLVSLSKISKLVQNFIAAKSSLKNHKLMITIMKRWTLKP